jgi:hypothetical protein
MRVRAIPLMLGIFVVAALATVFVVRQLPREGERSDAHAEPPPRVVGATLALEPTATAADGFLELRVTAGPEPLAGAEARAYVEAPPPPGELASRWFRAGSATTDAAGVARIPARPGAYLVAVRAAGLAPSHVEVVRAAGEAATRADVVLAPPVALEGRVTLRPGSAPAVARVTAIPRAGAGLRLAPPSAPPEEEASVVTDANGAFRLEGLAPGTFAVRVEALGAHPALLPRVAVPRDDALDVALEPLGVVEGAIRLADGRPAAGATVRAASRDHGAAVKAGDDGRFAIPVPPGSYTLLAALGDGAGASGPVMVAAGAKASGLVVTLGPAARIDGQVVEATSGRPVPDAEVAVFPHETSELVARATVGPDGRFTVPGLAQAAYDVRAAARGRTPALVRAVTLAGGAPFALRVALAGSGTILGTVRDAADRPVAGARVRVTLRGDGLVAAVPLEARTDFEGRYRLDGVEVGGAELIARQDAVALGAARAVRVEEGATSRADFTLPGAGLLAGRVRREGHGTLLGTAVVAVPLQAGPGHQLARALADAIGNYRLALPAGEYRVHAAPADADRTDLRVAPAFARVDEGQTTRLDVTAARAAAEEGLEIVVREPGGAPSMGATVTLARTGDDRVALATSAGEDGRVVVAKGMGLAGRPVTVRARNGGRSGVWSGTLPASGAVEVELQPGAGIVGTLRATGAPPRGFRLEVASQPAPATWRTLDAHRFAGTEFQLGDLPTDPVRVTVVADDGRRGSADVQLAPGETRRVEIAIGR